MTIRVAARGAWDCVAGKGKQEAGRRGSPRKRPCVFFSLSAGDPSPSVHFFRTVFSCVFMQKMGRKPKLGGMCDVTGTVVTSMQPTAHDCHSPWGGRCVCHQMSKLGLGLVVTCPRLGRVGREHWM